MRGELDHFEPTPPASRGIAAAPPAIRKLVLATVIVVAIPAVAPGGGLASQQTSGRVSVVPSALITHFRILRRPLRPTDRLPPHAPRGLTRSRFLGLLPSLARREIFPGTGARAWLVPGRRGFCYLAQDRSGGYQVAAGRSVASGTRR